MKKIIPALFFMALLFPILIYSAPVDKKQTPTPEGIAVDPQQPTPVVVVFLESDPRVLHENCQHVRFLEFRGAEERRQQKAQEYNLSVSFMVIRDLKKADLPVRIPPEGAFLCEYRDPSGFDIG